MAAVSIFVNAGGISYDLTDIFTDAVEEYAISVYVTSLVYARTITVDAGCIFVDTGSSHVNSVSRHVGTRGNFVGVRLAESEILRRDKRGSGERFTTNWPFDWANPDQCRQRRRQ